MTSSRKNGARLEDVVDPIKFIKLLWPHISLYDKQKEILYSMSDNDETFVPAGNMLGKDFIAGLGVLWFFLSRHPCRVITTSVDATQLNAVLWGEIRRFIQTSEFPLDSTDGGPLLVNDVHLRKIVNGDLCGLSYCLGRVATATGEGMLGHHIAKTGDRIPRTLFVADEASGVPTVYYEKADTWADRKLIIGNPYPCTNFFKTSVKEGNLVSTDEMRYFRKVIRIKAEDSPNVKLGLIQERKGIEPTNEMLIIGVKDYDTYKKNRKLWDKIRQCVSLDAEFWEGSDVLLYPPDWLNRAETYASMIGSIGRKGKAIGVDPAEGGDSTVWTVVDELGILEQISMKTPNTAVIMGQTIALMHRYGVFAENVCFDSGGGGQQHADYMHEKGYKVRSIHFGTTVTPPRKRGMTPLEQKIEADEKKYIYKNRRAEMYGILRTLLDPGFEGQFGIPAHYVELRRQLSVLPLWYDEEGRMYLPPKQRRKDEVNQSKKVTINDLIGCSPDEADSLVLAVYGLVNRAPKKHAGAIV